MQNRIKVVDLELSDRFESLTGLQDYLAVRALVRLYSTPLGYIEVPVRNGGCSSTALRKAAVDHYAEAIVKQLICSGLCAGQPGCLQFDRLTDAPPLPPGKRTPRVTVAVCTRDRVLELARCLDSLARLNYPDLEILVVDNAPSSDSTERLVRNSSPLIRYVCEPRPGLNWARNRAIMESTGEIIAFTDDDVIVDSRWLEALTAVFCEDSQVMAVTGLVVPVELETKAQIFFEAYGGCGRGFRKQWVNRENEWAGLFHAAWQFGSGANMAYRKSLFERIGCFDPALDVGTVANGGGDLEMFFRLLKQGATLVYEPGAIVRHRHRRSYDELRTQVGNFGVGYFSYLVRSAIAFPDEWAGFLRAGLRRMLNWNLSRLLLSLVHPTQIPRDLILVELVGSFVGLGRYQKSRTTAVNIAQAMGSPVAAAGWNWTAACKQPVRLQETTVRQIDLSEPLEPINELPSSGTVHLHVTYKDRYLGEVKIAHGGGVLSVGRISHALVDQLGLKLLNPETETSPELNRAAALAAANARFGSVQAPQCADRLPEDVSISVVVTAGAEPDALRRCLSSLAVQRSRRATEVLVVGPSSAGASLGAILGEFPNTRWVTEDRPGSAYARNAGVIASRCDIVVMTDASMELPPGWLEAIVTPFVQSDVMAVTGKVLLAEAGSEAQPLFESLAERSLGSDRRIVDGSWFKRFRYSGVPAWQLGSAENMALRARIFSHPQIGLLEETLGADRSNGAEESYLFYQILKAGYKIAYEPSAYAWHRPPAELFRLRQQRYLSAQGQIIFQLAALTRDRDLGALFEIAFHWPRRWGSRCVRRLLGQNKVPLWLLAAELAGSLTAPWRLISSIRSVKRRGRSGIYIPATQRSSGLWLPEQYMRWKPAP